MSGQAVLPPWVVLDEMLEDWLREDIGRGDRTTQSIFGADGAKISGEWRVKEPGVIAGLSVAARVFRLLDSEASFVKEVPDGTVCDRGQVVAQLHGSSEALLMGERVALNLAMRLSGIATATRRYVDQIADLPTQLVDTRKTTPGLRLLEKYATQVGGAMNHRMGLDDGVMIKDNHIAAAGGIGPAIARVRGRVPYPLTIEVETETLAQVEEALAAGADIIMLDNMAIAQMQERGVEVRH